jgi:hypothetical protein
MAFQRSSCDALEIYLMEVGILSARQDQTTDTIME